MIQKIFIDSKNRIHRLVQKGFFALAISQLFQRILGATREALIAVFFKVSETTNYFFMLKAVNDATVVLFGSNTIGSVIIPRLKRDGDGKILAVEISRMHRMGAWVGIGSGTLIFIIQMWNYFHNGLHYQSFGRDLFWSMIWLNVSIAIMFYNVFQRVLIQAVGDFSTLARNSLMVSFGLVLGPIICRDYFGFAGISFMRVTTTLLATITLRRALKNNAEQFSTNMLGHTEPTVLPVPRVFDAVVVMTNMFTANIVILWMAVTKMCLGGKFETTYYTYATLFIYAIYGITCVPISMIVLSKYSGGMDYHRRPNMERMGIQLLIASVIICLLLLSLVPIIKIMLLRFLNFRPDHANGVMQMIQDLVWIFPGSAIMSIFSPLIFARRGVENLIYNIISIFAVGVYSGMLLMMPTRQIITWGSIILFVLLAGMAYVLAHHSWRLRAQSS